MTLASVLRQLPSLAAVTAALGFLLILVATIAPTFERSV